MPAPPIIDPFPYIQAIVGVLLVLAPIVLVKGAIDDYVFKAQCRRWERDARERGADGPVTVYRPPTAEDRAFWEAYFSTPEAERPDFHRTWVSRTGRTGPTTQSEAE